MAKSGYSYDWVVIIFMAFVIPARAALDYEYDFVSSQAGVTGKIFLDASSSSSGTVADIGAGSYLSFNLYNGYIPPVTFSLSGLNTSLDPNFTFTWNSSEILSPLDFAVGRGWNDVLLSRQSLTPENSFMSPMGPEYDTVVYDSVYVANGLNVLTGQSLASSMVSLTASESTINVNGAGVVYNIPFYSGTDGEWVAVAVPEPGSWSMFNAISALFAVLILGIARKNTPMHDFAVAVVRRFKNKRR